MKAFGRLIASLLDRMGLRKVSSVSLLLLVSLPRAFHEVHTSPEQALVQPSARMVSSALHFPKVCQRHSFAAPMHKSRASCSGGKCGRAEIGMWMDECRQSHKLLVHGRNASPPVPPAKFDWAARHKSYGAPR